MIVRKHVFVRGRVQGVLFRDSTRRKAQAAGVVGWVRNCPDGSLEAVIEGEDAAAQGVVEFLKTGPRGAAVEEIEIRDEQPQGLELFRIEG